MDLDYGLSSSSNTVLNKVRIILNGPEDWYDWKDMIKQRAQALAV